MFQVHPDFIQAALEQGPKSDLGGAMELLWFPPSLHGPGCSDTLLQLYIEPHVSSVHMPWVTLLFGCPSKLFPCSTEEVLMMLLLPFPLTGQNSYCPGSEGSGSPHCFAGVDTCLCH